MTEAEKLAHHKQKRCDKSWQIDFWNGLWCRATCLPTYLFFSSRQNIHVTLPLIVTGLHYSRKPDSIPDGGFAACQPPPLQHHSRDKNTRRGACGSPRDKLINKKSTNAILGGKQQWNAMMHQSHCCSINHGNTFYLLTFLNFKI